MFEVIDPYAVYELAGEGGGCGLAVRQLARKEMESCVCEARKRFALKLFGGLMAPPVAPKKTFQYKNNIYILEDGVKYRMEVDKILKRIESTFTGRTVTKYIYARGRKMLIIPYVPSKEDPVNAYASADKWLDAMPKGDFAVAYYTYNIPNYGELKIPAIFEGTGVGSTVTLKYHPATWRQMERNAGYLKPGSGAGEILLHEMLHGLQQMNGALNQDAVLENPHMDTFTEFCAIVTANMYRSERGFMQLRADHHAFAALGRNVGGKDLTKPEIFASVYEAPFQKWFNLQQAFCLELAQSRASFNPVKYAAMNLGHTVRTSMTLP